jgi:hypothetical protein
VSEAGKNKKARTNQTNTRQINKQTDKQKKQANRQKQTNKTLQWYAHLILHGQALGLDFLDDNLL